MQVEYQGKTYTVDDEALDDIDVFEDLVQIQSGDVSPMKRVIEAIIGEDGYKMLKDSLRNEKGRAKTTEVLQGFNAIMVAAGEDKKK